MSKTPHKWADVIKAFADGAEIEVRHAARVEGSKVTDWYKWTPKQSIAGFNDVSTTEYRVKPEPKPDVVEVQQVCITPYGAPYLCTETLYPDSIRGVAEFTFDGETGKLKSVSVINKD